MPEKQAVFQLALRGLARNKRKNFISILAIALTCVLFTSVFTMLSASIQAIEQREKLRYGTDFHATVANCFSEEELDVIRTSRDIAQYSETVDVAQGYSETAQATYPLVAADDKFLPHTVLQLEQGRMPEAENEIVLDQKVLMKLSMPLELGQSVRLSLEYGAGQPLDKEFIVTGFYRAESDTFLSNTQFVSRALADELNADQPDLKTLYILFHNSFDLEHKMEVLTNNPLFQSSYDINPVYRIRNFIEDPWYLVYIGIFALLVLISGYLFIFNVFYISVVKDVQFYGLLTTVGMTKAQLRTMIFLQAFALYCIALPIGLLLGYLVGGSWLAPLFASKISPNSSPSISPAPFVFSAVFTLITLCVSIIHPQRLAEKVSRIQAIGFTGVGRIPKHFKKTAKPVGLARMALRNVARHWKRTLIVALSMSLSIFIFNSVFTVYNNVNYDQYAALMIHGDFELAAENYVQRDPSDSSSGPVNRQLCDQIEAIEGVRAVSPVYFKDLTLPFDRHVAPVVEPMAPYFLETDDSVKQVRNGAIEVQLHGIDETWEKTLPYIKNEILAGSFDSEQFHSGNYVIVCQSSYPPWIKDKSIPKDRVIQYYQPGDKINLGGDREYEVMMVLEERGFLPSGTHYYPPFGYRAFLPSQEFERSFANPDGSVGILKANIFVDSGRADQVESRLQALTLDHKNLELSARQTIIDNERQLLAPSQTIGYVLSSIIAVIAIVNYINTVMTSALARKREFALLESVGMTRRQKQKLLLFENLYSVLLILILSLTIGLALTVGIIRIQTAEAIFLGSELSPVLLLWIPLLLLLGAAVTLLSYRTSSKTDVIARLQDL